MTSDVPGNANVDIYRKHVSAMLGNNLHDLKESLAKAVASGPQHLEMKVLLPDPVTPITAMKTSVGLYNWSGILIDMAMRTLLRCIPGFLATGPAPQPGNRAGVMPFL